MAFTIRSLFNRGTSGSSGIEEGGSSPFSTSGTTAVQEMSPSSAPPAQPMSNSPFGFSPPAAPQAQPGFGSTLFKTREGTEETQGSPFMAQAVSPFAPTGGTMPVLTAGDVMPMLPPDLARPGALPPEHSIQLAPQVIEAALAGGQAAIPVFEIYRVCPALFLGAVSPQDTRLVPLPAHKLPALVAATPRQAMPQAAPAGAMPFPFAQTQRDMPGAAPMMQPSPFQSNATGAGTMLPPQREAASPFAAAASAPAAASPFGSPFAIPGAIGGAPAPEPVAPPPMPGTSLFGGNGAGSPFAAAAPAASPFAANETEQAEKLSSPAVPSLFGTAAGAGSPFAAPAVAETPAASPFAAPVPEEAGKPSAAPLAAASPFASMFTEQPAPAPAAAAPFSMAGGGMPAFALTEPAAPPSTQPMPAAPAPMEMPKPVAQAAAPASSSPLKMPLAALIKGLTSTELGFEPAMVPTWITTSLPASALTSASGFSTVNVDLGTLIDGVTDIGFRNVLANARRDLSIAVPTNDVFHALPATTPAVASAPPPGPAQAATNFLEATPPPAFGGMFSGAPQQTPAPAQVPVEILATPKTAAPFSFSAAEPAASPFGAATEPSSPPPMPGALPQATTIPVAATQAPVQPMAGINFGFPAASAPTPEPPAMPAEPPAAAATMKNIITPRPGAFDPFATTVAPAWGGPPAPSQTVEAAKPATPMVNEGFSSDQLFGAPPVPAAVPAAPAIPPPTPAFGATAGFAMPPVAASTGFSMPAVEPAAAFGAPAAAPPMPAAAAPAFPPEPPAAPATVQAGMPAAHSQPQAQTFGTGFGSFGAATAAEPPTVPPPIPATANVPAPKTAALGLTAATGDTEQLMLRALLGASETLTAERVVELVSKLPGVTACACIHGGRVISAGNATGASQDFQRQAADLSKSVQALIPLIGIEGAETFSLNTGERLITFAYHAPLAFGVLHQDQEPAAGLRDKITLVSRELSRMWSRSGTRA